MLLYDQHQSHRRMKSAYCRLTIDMENGGILTTQLKISVCKTGAHEALLCEIVLANSSQINLFNVYTVDYNVHVKKDEVVRTSL